MSDAYGSKLRTVQRQKSAASSITNPSLASPGIPTLANPVRGLGSQTAPPQTITEIPDLQKAQSANEKLAESEAIKAKPLCHDISRISLRRPQAKLTIGEPTDQYEQEADWMANRVMSMPAPTLQQEIIPEKQTQEEVQTKPLAAATHLGYKHGSNNLYLRRSQIAKSQHNGFIQKIA